MEELNIWFVPFAFLLFTIVGIALRFTQPFILRTYITLGFTVILVLGMYTFSEVLGRPKPTNLEILNNFKEAEILSTKIIQSGDDAGIYLWLEILPNKNKDGEIEGVLPPNYPLYYKMPYDQETAQNLIDQLRKGQKRNERSKMILPWAFDDSLEEREPQMFHGIPQPRMPRKDEGNEKPEEIRPFYYNHQGQGV